jgi:hypothetical protein
VATNKAYLDTSAVSALARQDIKLPGEMSALEQLLAWHESGKVFSVCSPVVEEELAKIRPEYIQAHLNFFDKFASLPKADVGGLTQLGPSGLPMGNPRYRLLSSLRKVLPDEPDAWHIRCLMQSPSVSHH